MKHPTLTAMTFAASLPLLTTATAQDEDWRTWGDMREQVVSAEDVLESDVSNGLNPVASVSDLVLSADGRRIEHVLMEVPFPYTVYGGEDGFVAWDRIDLQRGAGFDFDLVIQPDEQVGAPEELELSGTEAENRLVSRLIDERIHFGGDSSRQVTDILIDRDTGTVTHWVVETAEDAVFSTERRAIPADEISIEEGSPSTQIDVATLDDLQDYDSRFL